MGKTNKTVNILVILFFVAIISIVSHIAFADYDLSVVDVEYKEYDLWNSSILYSDNRLLVWNEGGKEEIIQNVKKREHIEETDFKPVYLTTNNELYYDVNSESGEMKKISNVVDFKSFYDDYYTYIVYKDTNNSLNYLAYNEYGEQAINLNNYETYNFLDLLNIYSIEHNITNYQENSNQVPVYLVFNKTCGVCKMLMQYLSELDSSIYNKIKIIGIDINDYYNYDLFELIETTYDISLGSTPTIIVGDNILIGFSELHKESLETYIDEMYTKSVSERPDFIKEYNSQFKINPVKISDNVNQFEVNKYNYDKVVTYTTNDKLYMVSFYDEAYEEISIEIENVKEIGKQYILNKNNELYLFPKIFEIYEPIVNNIESVQKIKSNENTTTIIANNTNGTQTFIYYDNDEESYVSYYGPTFKDVNYPNDIYYYTKYFLTEDGKLYSENTSKHTPLTELQTNVKEVMVIDEYSSDEIYVLDKNGNLYFNCYLDGCNANNFIEELTGQTLFEKNHNYLLLENVESIKYIDKYFILMKDGSVYRFGDNYHNEFKGMDEIYSSNIPVQIDELINNGKEITTKKVYFFTDRNEISLGEILYEQKGTIPANANENTIFTVDNEEVLKPKNKNLIGAKVGTTNYCVGVASNNSLTICKKISVHPNINFISVNENEIDMNVDETLILDIDFGPDNALSTELNLEWKINGKYNYEDVELEFDNVYNSGEYKYLEPSQFAVTPYKGGTYEIELHQVGCDDPNCYTTVKLNVTEYVYRIKLDIDSEYFDGINNAYMFINEKETLQINHSISPSTATNKKINYYSSNNSIASVDENGLITAHNTGEVIITLMSDDGSSGESFNLTVYDYSKVGTSMKGDVNKDGEVNILDVIKLRKYLAGLEDLDIE